MAAKPPNRTDPVSVEALFLGPQSENEEFFRSTLDFLIAEHVHWRRDFHPRDRPIVTPEEMRAPDFLATQDRTKAILLELSARLKDASTPWFSTRYLGHMNSDTLMVANLARMVATLYNPNNVTYESSMATSPMEIECGQDFARLVGYDPRTSWGHITTDGTVANYEALWWARNLKSFPAAVARVAPALVQDRDPWELLNLSSSDTLDLLDRAKQAGVVADALRASVRGTGTAGPALGKLLVPSTRHYSWEKAADILGVGVENVVKVPVTDRFRIDVDRLREIIDRYASEQVPILGVVGVVGTTEEGAVDAIDALVGLRQESSQHGVSYYLHVDAAYGGYARSLFLDPKGRFAPYEEVQSRLAELGAGNDARPALSRSVWAAYRAISETDSVTIDPHKMGYVPYSAGGVALRDRRVLGLVSYSAAYVFDERNPLSLNLGSVILEGSKSGAAAASVWAAHRLVPLDARGYGQIVARSIGGAYHFVKTLEAMREFQVGGQRLVCEPLLAEPDLNIVCMAFNLKENSSLRRMNRLNEALYHASSYESGPLYSDKWITSHTVLEREVYGDSPLEFLRRLGIPADEWTRVGTVDILRAVVMHPWIANASTYPERWESYLSIMKREMERIVSPAHRLGTGSAIRRGVLPPVRSRPRSERMAEVGSARPVLPASPRALAPSERDASARTVERVIPASTRDIPRKGPNERPPPSGRPAGERDRPR